MAADPERNGKTESAIQAAIQAAKDAGRWDVVLRLERALDRLNPSRTDGKNKGQD